MTRKRNERPTFGYDEAVWDEAKEQARVVLAELASRRSDAFTGYRELAAQITAIKFHHNVSAFHNLLGQLSDDEAAAGRGMLSALVVNQETLRPGGGFFTLAKHLGRDVANKDACWLHEVEIVRAAHRTKQPKRDTK